MTSIIQQVYKHFNWHRKKVLRYYRTNRNYKKLIHQLLKDINQKKYNTLLIADILMDVSPMVINNLCVLVKNYEIDEFVSFLKRAIDE